jgi:hypothetical protein
MNFLDNISNYQGKTKRATAAPGSMTMPAIGVRELSDFC